MKTADYSKYLAILEVTIKSNLKGKTVNHKSKHSSINYRFIDFDQEFVIFAQTPTSS